MTETGTYSNHPFSDLVQVQVLCARKTVELIKRATEGVI